MKNVICAGWFLLIILGFASCSKTTNSNGNQSSGQFKWVVKQQGLPHNFTKVSFALNDAAYGIACNCNPYYNQESTQLYQTSDSGHSWTALSSSMLDTVNDIIQLDQNVLIVVANGQLYRSTDNGQTFSREISRTDSTFVFAVDFFDSQNGMAAGIIGTSQYITSDGGQSWQLIPNNESFYSWQGLTNSYKVKQIEYLEIGKAAVSLVGKADYYYAYTHDTGQSWTNSDNIASLPNQLNEPFTGFGFASDGGSVFFVSMSDGAYRSSNDGQSFSLIFTSQEMAGGNFSKSGSLIYGVRWEEVLLNTYSNASDSSAFLRISYDDGVSWVNEEAPERDFIMDFAILTDSMAVAVGEDGIIYRREFVAN